MRLLAPLRQSGSNARSPEDDKIGPPIEYVFTLGAATYALEHTVVEAFERQIQMGIDFAVFVAPIVDALDHQMPVPGKYALSFSVHPTKEMRPKKIAKAQKSIVEWVKLAGTGLHAECPEQPTRYHKPHGHRGDRKATLEDIELVLRRETGWWMPEKAKGRLFPVRTAPNDHEVLRRVRLGVTMERKLPKLWAWKNDGARSVLVLENRDLFLSNHVLILEAAEEALLERTDPPDEVWLVDTTIEEEWTVWCLIRDGVSLPDNDTATPFREFRPDDLTEV